jgi:hypothetical protein
LEDQVSELTGVFLEGKGKIILLTRAAGLLHWFTDRTAERNEIKLLEKETSMKLKSRVLVLVSSLLICILVSSCSAGGQGEPTSTQIPIEPSTSTPIPTQAPTITPTATLIPSPTPIPGVFLNRPAYLQELFSNTDWVWVDHSIGATVGTLQYSPSTQFMLVYGTDETTANDFIISGRFDIDPEDRIEDEEFFYEFISILLQDFVPVSTSELLVQFIADNKDSEVYETTMDGFSIYLSIQDDTAKNNHMFFLSIEEKIEE